MFIGSDGKFIKITLAYILQLITCIWYHTVYKAGSLMAEHYLIIIIGDGYWIIQKIVNILIDA